MSSLASREFYCLSLDGQQLWHALVGDQTHGWGSASSPILYGNLLIVNASVESNQLVAFDKISGKEVWSVPGIRGVWDTPALVNLPDGGTELVINTPGQPEGFLLGLDPATGKEHWRCRGIPTGVTFALPRSRTKALSMPSEAGRIPPLPFALAGAVTSPTIVVFGRSAKDRTSHPLFISTAISTGYTSVAVLPTASMPADGTVVYEERLTPAPGIVYSSVVAADGKLYCVSQENGTYVLAAKPQFELLAHNRFEDDGSRTNASPVISGGCLLLRTDRHLYCLGN